MNNPSIFEVYILRAGATELTEKDAAGGGFFLFLGIGLAIIAGLVYFSGLYFFTPLVFLLFFLVCLASAMFILLGLSLLAIKQVRKEKK